MLYRCTWAYPLRGSLIQAFITYNNIKAFNGLASLAIALFPNSHFICDLHFANMYICAHARSFHMHLNIYIYAKRLNEFAYIYIKHHQNSKLRWHSMRLIWSAHNSNCAWLRVYKLYMQNICPYIIIATKRLFVRHYTVYTLHILSIFYIMKKLAKYTHSRRERTAIKAIK